jgi:hypothetical protein
MSKTGVATTGHNTCDCAYLSPSLLYKPSSEQQYQEVGRRPNPIHKMHLLELMLRNPLKTLVFGYTFLIQSAIVVLRRLLLPHIQNYQSVRLQLQRAYMSACSATFPDLTYRLPVGPVPESKARRIGSDWTGYVIPGCKSLDLLRSSPGGAAHCVALYAHGGGYARGEAKMYINYMERWTRVAAKSGLDLTFLSVEYRKIPGISLHHRR